MKRFYRLTPYFRLSSNPLFLLETRHSQHGGSPQALIDYSLLRILIICAALLAIWTFLTVAYPRPYSYVNPVGLEFMLFVAVLSLLAGFVLDFFGIANALASIAGDVTASRWELLRLTLLSPRHIVAAKHGTAQVRVWRILTIIIGARVAVLLMLVLNLIFEYFRLPGYSMFSGASLLTVVIVLAVGAASATIFMLEPFWRLKTVTALGVAVSALARQTIPGILRALWTLVVFWVGQGILILALLLGMLSIIFPMMSVEILTTDQLVVTPLLFLLVLFVAIYGFYFIIQASALRRAERYAARID